jgi:hypothetical protein
MPPVLFAQYFLGDKIENNEMGGALSACGAQVRFIRGSVHSAYEYSIKSTVFRYIATKHVAVFLLHVLATFGHIQ